MKIFLKKAKPPYKEGLNYIEFKAPDDRYAGQLHELARILRGEIPNPPGLYEHDLKVAQGLAGRVQSLIAIIATSVISSFF